nr:MAG TPA: hypothetical protein [Caudoviricetes sp.]
MRASKKTFTCERSAYVRELWLRRDKLKLLYPTLTLRVYQLKHS